MYKRQEASDVVRVAAGTDLVTAEAQQAVLKEGALRLEDYWARRSSRAWFDSGAGLPILERAAQEMADLLGWDEARKTAEIDNCRQIDRESRAGYAMGVDYGGRAFDVSAAG